LKHIFHTYNKHEVATPAPESKAWEMRLLLHKLANASGF